MEVDRSLSDKQLFESVSIQIGGHDNSENGPHSSQVNTSASNLGQIDIKLVPSVERSIGAAGIERIWQNKLSGFTKAKKISLESSLVRDGADIDLQLAGRDTVELNEATDFLKSELARLEHLYEISDSSEPGKLEYQFELSETGRSLGLTPVALAAELRGAFYGIEIQRIQRGANELKGNVKV